MITSSNMLIPNTQTHPACCFSTRWKIDFDTRVYYSCVDIIPHIILQDLVRPHLACLCTFAHQETAPYASFEPDSLSFSVKDFAYTTYFVMTAQVSSHLAWRNRIGCSHRFRLAQVYTLTIRVRERWAKTGGMVGLSHVDMTRCSTRRRSCA